MPGYRGHLAGGIVAFAVTCLAIKFFHPESVNHFKDVALGLAVCLLGALFPDIDIKSVGQRIFYFAVFPLIVLAIATKQFLLLSVLSVIALIPVLVSHRGLIHKWWFVVFAPLIIPVLFLYQNGILFMSSVTVYLYFVSGALSHLLLDYGIWKFFKRVILRK